MYIYSIQKDTLRAGEMTQGLSIHCSSRGPEFDSWYPQGSSMLSVVPVQGDLTSLSSFCGDLARMCWPERHGRQTLVPGEKLKLKRAYLQWTNALLALWASVLKALLFPSDAVNCSLKIQCISLWEISKIHTIMVTFTYSGIIKNISFYIVPGYVYFKNCDNYLPYYSRRMSKMEIFGGISWSCSITFPNYLELSSINWPSQLYVKQLSVLDRISITVIKHSPEAMWEESVYFAFTSTWLPSSLKDVRAGAQAEQGPRNRSRGRGHEGCCRLRRFSWLAQPALLQNPRPPVQKWHHPHWTGPSHFSD